MSDITTARVGEKKGDRFWDNLNYCNRASIESQTGFYTSQVQYLDPHRGLFQIFSTVMGPIKKCIDIFY